MQTLVSDEVWSQLPQRRLPRGRVLGVLGAALLALAAALVVDRLGVVRPHLAVEPTGAEIPHGERRFSETLGVSNHGVSAATVTGVEVAAPWLEVTAVRQLPAGDGPPLVLPAHSQRAVRLELRVLDCSALTRADVGLALRVRGPLGTWTLRPHLRGTGDPAAPTSYSYTGTDPWEVPWAVADAADACRAPLPPSADQGR